MDKVTRDGMVRGLKEQLQTFRVKAASLDNDADRQNEIKHTIYPIQLLLEFFERANGNE